MKKRTIFNLLIFVLAVGFLLMPIYAHAASSWLINIAQPDVIKGSQLTSFETAVTYLYGLMVEIAGIIFLLLFLFGGIMYMTSGGAEEQTTKARKWLLDAVIGLAIVAVAWAAGTWIENSLLNTGSSNPSSSPTSSQSSQPTTQTQTATGVINNTNTGVGAVDPGTKVYAESSTTGYSATTDSSGNYTMAVPSGTTYTFTYTKNGSNGSVQVIPSSTNSNVPANPVTNPSQNNQDLNTYDSNIPTT